MVFIQLMQNGEPIEVPVEMIIPRYMIAKKQLPLKTEMTVEWYKKLENFQLSNAEHYKKKMKLVELNNFKIVVVLDYVLKELSEEERETFERLTYIPPLRELVIDLENLSDVTGTNVAHKCTDKYKGFPDPYLKEKLLPMFPGRKSIKKDIYKSLCFGLDKGIEEVQKQVGCGELFLEDMLTIAYTE